MILPEPLDPEQLSCLRKVWRGRLAALGPIDITAELQGRADAAGLSLSDYLEQETDDLDADEPGIMAQDPERTEL